MLFSLKKSLFISLLGSTAADTFQRKKFPYPHDQLRSGAIRFQSLHTICAEAMDPCGCREFKKTTFGLLQIKTEINTFIKYAFNPQHSELIVT